MLCHPLQVFAALFLKVQSSALLLSGGWIRRCTMEFRRREPVGGGLKMEEEEG